MHGFGKVACYHCATLVRRDGVQAHSKACKAIHILAYGQCGTQPSNQGEFDLMRGSGSQFDETGLNAFEFEAELPPSLCKSHHGLTPKVAEPEATTSPQLGSPTFAWELLGEMEFNETALVYEAETQLPEDLLFHYVPEGNAPEAVGLDAAEFDWSGNVQTPRLAQAGVPERIITTEFGSKCALCQEMLATDREAVFQHAKHHAQAPPEPRFECPSCHILFAYEIDLALHRRPLVTLFSAECPKVEPHDGEDWVALASQKDRKAFVDELRRWECVQLYRYLATIASIITTTPTEGDRRTVASAPCGKEGRHQKSPMSAVSTFSHGQRVRYDNNLDLHVEALAGMFEGTSIVPSSTAQESEKVEDTHDSVTEDYPMRAIKHGDTFQAYDDSWTQEENWMQEV